MEAAILGRQKVYMPFKKKTTRNAVSVEKATILRRYTDIAKIIKKRIIKLILTQNEKDPDVKIWRRRNPLII